MTCGRCTQQDRWEVIPGKPEQHLEEHSQHSWEQHAGGHRWQSRQARYSCV